MSGLLHSVAATAYDVRWPLAFVIVLVAAMVVGDRVHTRVEKARSAVESDRAVARMLAMTGVRIQRERAEQAEAELANVRELLAGVIAHHSVCPMRLASVPEPTGFNLDVERALQIGRDQ